MPPPSDQAVAATSLAVFWAPLAFVSLALSLFVLPHLALLLVGRWRWGLGRTLLLGLAVGGLYGTVPAVISTFHAGPYFAALAVAVVMLSLPAALFLIPDRASAISWWVASTPLGPLKHRFTTAAGLALGAWTAVLAFAAVRGIPYG